jgi:hypothetical protein
MEMQYLMQALVLMYTSEEFNENKDEGGSLL